MNATDSSSLIRVCLVEDEPAVREDLSLLLQGCPGIRMVASYASAEEAINHAVVATPDVILVDINLPATDGIECVRTLKALLPKTHFLMLTVYEDSGKVFESLRVGATGYLVKRFSRTQLLAAIHEVRDGGSPMSSHIARKVVQFFHQGSQSASDSDKLERHSLSPRELEVLQRLAQGLLYKEIAAQLGISVDTVRKHISSIYGKLQVHSRTEAVVKFLNK